MGRYICELKGLYFEWSSIVDAPVTRGMELEEFEEYYKEAYGTEGMRNLPERLQRVNKKGTSAIDKDLKELIEFNRAGENETSLSREQLFELISGKRKKSVIVGFEWMND